MRRILALLPNEPGYAPGQRSTIEIWQEPLRRSGFDVAFAPFEGPRLRAIISRRGNLIGKAFELLRCYAGRIRLLRDVSRWDAVVVYREAALIGPALLERWVSRCKVPIIYVLDDPLYIPYVSPANGWFSYLKCFGKVATICRLSQAVIANSTAHVDFARRYCANVHQIPSVVDGTAYRYTPRPHSEGPVRIGWSGSPTTAGNLRMIAGALTELAKRVRYRLHLIGSEVLPIPGTDCIAQHWHGPTEIEDLLQLDIGLAPLPDNAWNRRKFNMKIAQYMCLGIVPVATPLGSNREVISPGVDGFLPESAEEWTASLETLVLDEVLRRSMAARAAHKAAASFTVQAQFPNVLRAFSSALPW